MSLRNLKGFGLPSLEETIAFITAAHAGQTDKGGQAYHLHPIAVMNRLPEGADLDLKLAALLHDVLEDTAFDRQHLAAMGYSKRTLDAVEAVTQIDGDPRSYAEKIDAIIASGNRDAIQLKLADMSENMDPDRLAALPSDKRAYFLAKYSGPFEALRRALA